MKLDDWQKQVLETKGNICLRSGRQVGKSTIIAQKAAEYALKNKDKNILIIASVERQALLLFEKTLAAIFEKGKDKIKKGKDKPTKHKLSLTNGSTIYCLPTGISGHGIRGYTIDLLIADEAAFIPDDVWTAVVPMLLTTGGDIILLSTPFGKRGFFYECFEDDTFTKFHISSEEVILKREFSDEWNSTQREKALQHLEQKQKLLSKVEYAQEYLGEFVDELKQFFPNELIKKCMTLKKGQLVPTGKNYLGVDVARMGEDESVMYSLTRVDKKLYSIDMRITKKTLLTETIKEIKSLNRIFNYRKIYIDDGGMGVGVFDPLLEDEETKRKVVAINNSVRSLDKDERRAKKLMKEDLYNNLLVLMEKGQIHLYDDDDVYTSLRSIQGEYTEKGLRIFGNYTHITEALIRAAWCMKDKTLNIWIR